jgi:hypothetical protein
LVDNKNVLEFGDPSAKLANKLNTYSNWFIVEPNKNNDIVFNKNISFIETFFDESFVIDHRIDLIVHSHFFEHTYEPTLFLKNCFDILNDGGEMIFGIPNMEHIANHNLAPFLGLFFEHTVCMTVENISYMLSINKFEIIDIFYFEHHSIIFHVKKNINHIHASNELTHFINFKSLFENTLDQYKTQINMLNEKLLQSKKDIYIFGASYNTQFLLSIGLNINRISGILDNSTEKHFKYLYGFNLLIYNPEIIKNKEIIVIIPNSAYKNEINAQLENLRKNTEIFIMN